MYVYLETNLQKVEPKYLNLHNFTTDKHVNGRQIPNFSNFKKFFSFQWSEAAQD